MSFQISPKNRLVPFPPSHSRQTSRSSESLTASPRSSAASSRPTTAEKYAALASKTPDALRLVNDTIEYLYDLEVRRNPNLFVIAFALGLAVI